MQARSALSFVPLVAERSVDAQEACVAPPVELHMAGGMLRIPPGTDAALLTTVLRALRAAPDERGSRQRVSQPHWPRSSAASSITALPLLGGTPHWLDILEADAAPDDNWIIAAATPDASGLTRRSDDTSAWSAGECPNATGSLVFSLQDATTETPEPSSLALLCAGLALLGATRRRFASGR